LYGGRQHHAQVIPDGGIPDIADEDSATININSLQALQ
jgi:hypothetical protein